MNATAFEYECLVEQVGYREAHTRFSFSLVYHYATAPAGSVWVMFYSTEDSREEHARAIVAMGGKTLGASGGDTSRVNYRPTRGTT